MTDNRTTALAQHPGLTDRERILVSALRYAWHELNTIKARDGVAYHRTDGMPYCTKEWWESVTYVASAAIKTVTGEPAKPWPFVWETALPPLGDDVPKIALKGHVS